MSEGRKLLTTLTCLFVLVTMTTFAIYGVEHAFGFGVGAKPAVAVVEPVKTTGEIELLAVTDSGIKVWRVTHERAVVPIIIAETKDGHISLR